MNRLKNVLSLSPFILLGAGVGCWIHPGAGMAAAGILMWLDMRGSK